MKNLVIFLSVFVAFLAFSQQQTAYINEEKAIFPKGPQEFRKMIMQNFRMEKIASTENENIHAELTFVIDQEGYITDINANGNNKDFNTEAIYAISQIKEKWIPHKINGIAVRSRFKVPLDLKFEDEDIQPTYFLGNEEFKNMVTKKISLNRIKEKVNMHCEISFVVETNGDIINLNATGNNDSLNKEAIRTVSKIKGRWNPGYRNGKPISKEVKIPLTISFDKKDIH